MNPVDERVLEAIQHLNYDFREFTLSHFIVYLSEQRQRPIILHKFPFCEAHALWAKTPEADYILYNQQTHRIHQIHSILHEVGHIVLNHAGRALSDVLSPELLAHLKLIIHEPVCGQLRAARWRDTPEEQEAEAFGRLLQKEIVFANRMDQLIGRASSIDELARFAEGLGYHD
jgi:hypothetical protein